MRIASAAASALAKTAAASARAVPTASLVVALAAELPAPMFRRIPPSVVTLNFILVASVGVRPGT